MGLTLDVGCGEHKRGNIGVDCRKVAGVDYVVDLNKELLPFADGSFETVVSYHLVEHLKFPELTIKEMVRVAKKNVMIVTHHRFSSDARKVKGDPYLNKRWFLDLAKKLSVHANVRTTYQPVLYFGVVGLFMRPYELYVDYRKR